MNPVSRFFAQLLRRKVVRLLGAYIALFWLLSQGFASLFPILGVPDGYLRAFVIVGIAAIPVLALLSWKYNLIPPAVVRDPGDVEGSHPMLAWAKRRHDNVNAGQLALQWQADDGKHERRFFGPATIGRESLNEVRLPHKYVSRFHAILWAEEGRWHVRDLESTNGTFIDGKRVRGLATLPARCQLTFHSEGPVVEARIDEVEATAVSTQH